MVRHGILYASKGMVSTLVHILLSVTVQESYNNCSGGTEIKVKCSLNSCTKHRHLYDQVYYRGTTGPQTFFPDHSSRQSTGVTNNQIQ